MKSKYFGQKSEIPSCELHEKLDRRNLPPVQKILEDEDFREERQRLLAGDPLRRVVTVSDLPDSESPSVDELLEVEHFLFGEEENSSECPVITASEFCELSLGLPDKKLVAANIFGATGTIILIHGEEAMPVESVEEEFEEISFREQTIKECVLRDRTKESHEGNLKTLPERKRQRLLRARTRTLLEKEGLKF